VCAVAKCKAHINSHHLGLIIRTASQQLQVALKIGNCRSIVAAAAPGAAATSGATDKRLRLPWPAQWVIFIDIPPEAEQSRAWPNAIKPS